MPTLALVAFAGACSAGGLPPLDATPKPPPRGVHEEFSRVGVCYNNKTATPQQVLAVARSSCESGTAPTLIEQDTLLTCPVLTPVRATFACLKPGTSLPPRR